MAFAQIDTNKFQQSLNETKEVNDLILTKIQLSAGINTEDNSLRWEFSPNSNTDGQEFTIYIDSCNKIRKYINTSYNEESSSVNIFYYDKTGHLVYTIQGKGILEDYDYHSFFYNLGGQVILGSVKYVCYNNPEESLNMIYMNKPISDIPHNSYMPLNTEMLLKMFNLFDFDITIPPGCPKIKFIKKPSHDTQFDLAFINRNNVSLYSGPGVIYSEIGQLNATDRVSIKNTGIMEDVIDLGIDYWFETSSGEFVFGAFLEPVERVVK